MREVNHGCYLLMGQSPVSSDDLMKWTQRFQTAERQVRVSEVSPLHHLDRVSVTAIRLTSFK